MAKESATGANIALSFLDVLACALGAVVLLFILFAVLQTETASGSIKFTDPFIRFEWRVHNDHGALLRVRILPPHGSVPSHDGEAFYIDLADLSTGTRKCRLPGMKSYAMVGFHTSESGITDARDTTPLEGDRIYILRLQRPYPGPWSVDLIYFDRSDDVLRRRDGLEVQTRIQTDPASAVEWAELPTKPGFMVRDGPGFVGLGATLYGPKVKIVERTKPKYTTSVCKNIDWVRP